MGYSASAAREPARRILVAGAALALCVSLMLVLFSALVESRTFERAIFQRVPAIGGSVIPYERERVSDSVRSFLRHGAPLSEALFSERERAHMADVRSLFDIARHAAVFITALAAALLAYAIVHEAGFESMKRCGYIGCVVGAGIALGALFSFDRLFTSFHELLFVNDLWLLDPLEHALIRAYPPDFFRYFAIIYLGAVITLSALLAVIGMLRTRRV